MTYFVVGPDGQRYGPSSTDTLNAWIVEGRLQAESTLEEEGTRRQLRAGAVPELRFAPPIPAVGPVGAYPRVGSGIAPNGAPLGSTYKKNNPNANFLGSIGLSLLGLVLAFTVSYFGFMISAGSVGLAWRAKTDDRHPGWPVALAISVVCFVVAIYFRIFHHRWW